MTYLKKCVVLGVLAAFVVTLAPGVIVAAGYNPILSASSQGGDSFRVTVSNAPAYSSITLYQRQGTTLWTTVTNFGQTDGNGYFTSIVGLGSTSSASPVEMYVTAGGYASNTVQAYPGSGSSSNCLYQPCVNYQLPSLSQTSVTLNPNQEATIVVYNAVASDITSGRLNISISNTNVVNAYLTTNTSGQVIIGMLGKQPGSATVNVCANYAASCVPLYVTVTGTTAQGSIWLSPSSLTMTAGDSKQVNIGSSGYAWIQIYPYNPYVISSNSNANVVSASVSGSTLYLNALRSGSSTVKVCIAGAGNVCADLPVTVNASASMSLTPSTVNLSAGQVVTVSAALSAPTAGYFYISSYPNTNVATVSVSDGTVTVYGVSNGATSATICYTGVPSCGTLQISVSGYQNSGYVSVSPSFVNMNVGQTKQVSINSSVYNYYGYIVGSNTNTNAVSASISGNTLHLYGVSNGSAAVQVCQMYSSSNCATVSVNVSSSGNYGTQPAFNTTALSQPIVNQYYSQQIQVGGGTTPYRFSLNYGTLPPGLTLSNDGSLYGTPTSSGAYTFSIRVSDYYGREVTQTFTATVNKSNVLGANTYASGTLVNENGTIYIVYKNTKTGFASWEAFSGLGFSLNGVRYVTNSGLVNSGYIVRTPYASHPWGSWIKSGNTVYFVHETGLIPVGDYNVFLNNGGQDSMVVPANTWDFSLPILPIMTHNDYRLK